MSAASGCTAEEAKGAWAAAKQEAVVRAPEFAGKISANPTPVGVALAGSEYLYQIIAAAIAGAGATHLGHSVKNRKKAKKLADSK